MMMMIVVVMTLVAMMVIMIIEERDFEICGGSSFSSDLKHFNRKNFLLKNEGKM